MEEDMEEIVAEQEPIVVIQLNESSKVVNFISVMNIEDMPYCVEWREGVSVGDTYDKDTDVFIKYVPPKVVPQSISMRQARLALLHTNLLDDVLTAIDGMNSPDKEIAKIEWDYSSEVWRSKRLVNTLAPMLGLSQNQLDDMFIYASKL